MGALGRVFLWINAFPYILFLFTWVYFLITHDILELINESHIDIVCVSALAHKLCEALVPKPRTMPSA